MDEQIKKAITWTLFIIIVVVIVLGVLIPWLALTYAPTFFPNIILTGFQNSMNTSSIIVSFASAFLGVFSVYQAHSSSKEMKNLIDSINELKQQQQQMNEMIKTKIVNTHPKTDDWKTDINNVE